VRDDEVRGWLSGGRWGSVSDLILSALGRLRRSYWRRVSVICDGRHEIDLADCVGQGLRLVSGGFPVVRRGGGSVGLSPAGGGRVKRGLGVFPDDPRAKVGPVQMAQVARLGMRRDASRQLEPVPGLIAQTGSAAEPVSRRRLRAMLGSWRGPW
jgi:hypothetical protein